MREATAVLGKEWDESRLLALGEVLRGLGAELNEEWSGFAGSQDVHHWEVLVQGRALLVETETYEGITISGHAELVREIVQRMGADEP